MKILRPMHFSTLKCFLFSVLTAILLSQCAAAFVAGAATGGYVIYDRRNLETVAQDQKIKYNVSSKISAVPAFKGSNIVVSSFNHVVLLAGQTPKASLRVLAKKIAATVPHVKKIYNEIEISSPTSTLTSASDTWITTKIKTLMLAKPHLKSSQIKVLTENGTVYLMGEVNHKQADMSVDIARKVTGVQKVVKVFDYHNTQSA